MRMLAVEEQMVLHRPAVVRSLPVLDEGDEGGAGGVRVNCTCLG